MGKKRDNWYCYETSGMLIKHEKSHHELCSSMLHLTFIQIPKRVTWEEYVPQGSDQWEWQMVVSKLFDERPIWPKESLTERLLDKGLSFTVEMLRRYSA